jgi:hypothetical protein
MSATQRRAFAGAAVAAFALGLAACADGSIDLLPASPEAIAPDAAATCTPAISPTAMPGGPGPAKMPTKPGGPAMPPCADAGDAAPCPMPSPALACQDATPLASCPNPGCMDDSMVDSSLVEDAAVTP